MSIADLRKSYERERLSEDGLDADPFVQFDLWFKAALPSTAEANAMTLATVGADGRPATRIVLLKGYETAAPREAASARGLVWYTNYESRKGLELAIHPHAALLFFWPELERQVRIEGLAEQVDAAESDAYFASRPRASQIGAWASPQSRPVADRAALEEAERAAAERFPGAVPRPPHWGGYRLVPDRFEFWQGRPSRLHDRIVYTGSDASAWRIERLAP